MVPRQVGDQSREEARRRCGASCQAGVTIEHTGKGGGGLPLEGRSGGTGQAGLPQGKGPERFGLGLPQHQSVLVTTEGGR